VSAGAVVGAVMRQALPSWTRCTRSLPRARVSSFTLARSKAKSFSFFFSPPGSFFISTK
jgi:hypothetical protein